MTGKEYVKQIKKIDTQIKNKTFELEQFRNCGLPAGNVLDSITDLCLKKSEIIKTIEKLPEAEYDVLHRAYVQYETLYEIADARGITYRHAAGIHGRALKRLDDILNCVEA